MENLVLGDGLYERQAPLDLATTSPPAPTAAPEASLAALGMTVVTKVVFTDGSAVPEISTITGLPIPTTAAGTTVVNTVSPSSTASTAPAADASAQGKGNGVSTTTLIAILVPIGVVLAVIPTAAYLIYIRKRDKKRLAMEAEILRGRGANSSSGATGEGLLMNRSDSPHSQHERKYTSVSTTELEMGAAGAAAMEKRSMTSNSHHRDNDIFAPAAHGPLGRQSPAGSARSQPRPGFKPPPTVSQSPTLPPLDFGDNDTNSLTPLTHNVNSSSATTSPLKPTVPASLPTFAPTQPKQRTPNPALAPGRTADSSPTSTDNPSWPLPAGGLRDSASTQNSVAKGQPSSHQLATKPLPTIMAKDASPASSARQPQQQQQHGPRESSIAYGVPPVPPSPVVEESGYGDRRSGVSRKRDSDAISELSYSASTRGRRNTQRDTDAISVISAMSRDER